MLKQRLGIWVFICGFMSSVVGAFVGINLGTDMSKLPPARDVVALLKAHQINHVRLFYSDHIMLRALSNTGIEVIVGVTNEEVVKFGNSPSKAARWVKDNVAAYRSTNITAIAVGNEVFTLLPSAARLLVPAMNHLHTALVTANLGNKVKISTPVSTDVIPGRFPPSTATFNSSWSSVVRRILQFIKNTNSFYMVNAYPYREYVDSSGVFSLEYALFEPLSKVKQIIDPNTMFQYDNMFDAMLDATYNAITSLNFANISVVVTETGWPCFGDKTEPEATLGNAETYNNNLVRRVMNGSGPPAQRGIPVDVYIYEMFNEDKMPGHVSERSWGILFSDGSAIYPLNLSGSGPISLNSSAAFCVAKPDADEQNLLDGIKWACGLGNANCSAVQQGKSCSNNTLHNRASYVYNDYYQRMSACGGTCDFGGTAMKTDADPSYGLCKFTKRSNLSVNVCPTTPTGPGPTSPTGEASRIHSPDFRRGVVAFLALVLLKLLV